MMSSTWKPLAVPDKENTAFAFKKHSTVSSSGPVKISNRGAIPKKQVFGDLKNTIQNFKGESDDRSTVKNIKSGGPMVKSDVKILDDNWPERGNMPANLYVEDNFEDCLLPGLQLSGRELDDLSNTFGKLPLATFMEPDSPICSPKGMIPLDIRITFLDEYEYEIPPPVWDDI